jgi:hypothetical protein
LLFNLSNLQKKAMKSTLILAACFALGASAAIAQTTPAGINSRQRAQQTRIAQGNQQCTVTKKEAHLLHKQQQHIRRAECRVKADGVVTPREGNMLRQKQNQASRSIHRAKHNGFDKKG